VSEEHISFTALAEGSKKRKEANKKILFIKTKKSLLKITKNSAKNKCPSLFFICEPKTNPLY
jgi:hypothetical protein